jgi:hypothetical protein
MRDDKSSTSTVLAPVFAHPVSSRICIIHVKIAKSLEKLKINYPDSATIFNISVKTKCKQTNPRFLTNVATSGDIAHANVWLHDSQ